MKRKILILCLLVCSGLLSAQQNRLIYKKSNLKSDGKANSILKKSTANKSVDFVNIDLEILADSNDIVLQFDDNEYYIKREKVKVRDIRNFCFIGKNKSQDGSIVMSVLDDDIQGTITYGNKVYRIETINKDDYAIVLLNHAELIEKCDNLTEKSVKSSQLKNSNLGSQNTDELNISSINSTQLESTSLSFLTYSCKIRVLVLYTTAARNSVSNIRNTVLLAIDETNQSFSNSGMNYEVELVYTAETNYTEVDIDTDMDRFAINGDGYMDEVHSLRDKYSADVCVLLNNDSQWCGVADAIGATSSTAFCVVKAYSCATGYYSFGHEIGHLLGCRHDTYVDNTSTPYPYGHGYIAPNKSWRTIMAYGNGCSNCPRLQYWANPNVTYGGVAMGTAGTNNTTRVWNEQTPTVLAFKQPANSVIVSSSDVANSRYSDIVAKQDISTNGNVNIISGSALYLRAGNSITLQAGFSTDVGSEFYAGIENVTDCGASSLKSAKVVIEDGYANSTDNIALSENDVVFNIFPNPTNDLLNIGFRILNDSEVSISLVNFLGHDLRKVQNRKLMNAGNYNIQMSVSDLPVGIYFIVLNVGENVIVKKIIIN
jgi:hypothetical protein